MLVLTRKLQEEICIGDNVKITVLRISGNSVRIGIEAPREVRIVRGELELQVAESSSDDRDVCYTKAENVSEPAHAPSSLPASPSRINRWSAEGGKTASTRSLLSARCRSESCRRRAS